MPVHGGRSGDDMRACAFERGGPRRGGVEPSSEADLARGSVESLERGELRSWERLTLERGEPRPRGHPPCHPVGLRGATRVVIVPCVCFRFVG
jgi:hypothetical protein